MPHAYTEDQLVEPPAVGWFAELGWAVAGPPPAVGVAGEPRDAGLLGRETKGEVVLVSRLRAALERLHFALLARLRLKQLNLNSNRSVRTIFVNQKEIP